ncbi:MAG: PKD domain-containing protein, partial [Candidatus Bipolaricaulota bacterium]
MRNRTRVVVAAVVSALGLSIALYANQPPVAQFTAVLVDGTSSAVVFDAGPSTDADGQVTRFQWTFGDGATGSGRTVEHAYASPGTFTVTLLVGDEDGATGLTTRAVDTSDLSRDEIATPAAAVPPASTAPIGYRIGQRAPEIALPTLDGTGQIRLSDFLGRVVLVEFWVSTCPGCRASLAGLQELWEAFSPQGFSVLLVALDRSAGDA